MKRDKHKIIADILSVTKANGEKYFDKLTDLNHNHLTKLLKVCTLLNK